MIVESGVHDTLTFSYPFNSLVLRAVDVQKRINGLVTAMSHLRNDAKQATQVACLCACAERT